MTDTTLQPFKLDLFLFNDPLMFIEERLDTPVRTITPGIRDRIANSLFSKYMHKCSKKALQRLFAEKLPDRPFFINTYGILHHFTYGLLHNLSGDSDIGYVHIDNHVDFGYKHRKKGKIGHSTFVNDIMDDGLASTALFIGDSRPGVLSVPRDKFGADSFRDTVSSQLDELPSTIYISLDVDVFSPAYINTPFINGSMGWDNFETLLDLFSEKEIVGVDVTGFPTSPTPVDRETYSTIAKAILDEPYDRKAYLDTVRSRIRTISSAFMRDVATTAIE